MVNIQKIECKYEMIEALVFNDEHGFKTFTFPVSEFDKWLNERVTPARFTRIYDMFAMGLEQELMTMAKKFVLESISHINTQHDD